MISYPRDNLVLGRGRLFFDPFTTPTGFIGEGERYVGNTDALTCTNTKTRVERTGNRNGRLVLLDTTITAETLTGTLVTDNMSVENVSDWFSATSLGVPATPGSTITTFTAKKGRSVQLGTSATFPAGRRGYSAVSVTAGGAAVPATSYQVDLADGRVFIPLNSPIADGTVLVATGVISTTLNEVTLKSTGKGVRGSLRFVSNSTRGSSRDLFVPACELRADSDQDFKGDRWQELRFTFAATARPGFELFYVVKRA